MSTTKEKRGHCEKNNEKADLGAAQVELVKLQHHVIETGQKILVILEGRDAAGKDDTITRIVQRLSPREVRVVALGKNGSDAFPQPPTISGCQSSWWRRFTRFH